MGKKFWKWNNSVDSKNSELILEGPISDVTWWGDEVTPQDFRDELAEHKGDITVVINSGGGDVFAGMSIYDSLNQHEGAVTVRVSGLAASIASVVAMAADKIIMAPGSMMMIHKPWGMVIGDTNDLDKYKEVLSGIENSIIPIYANRTGLSEDTIKDMLESETWMTAEEAVDKGFADEAVEAKQKMSISDAIKNAINGEFALSMSATKKSLEDLAAKITQADNEDSKETEAKVVAEVKEEVKEEVKTTVKEQEMTEVKEAVTANEEVVTEAKIKEIAQDQVLPQAQAKVEVVTNRDYLKSEESVNDFAKVLIQNAGRSTAEVQNAWKKKLGANNAVSNPTHFDLPEPLVSEIVDTIENSQIWGLFNHTGLDTFRVDFDETDPNTDTSRAGQWKRGATKSEQVLTFDKRVITADYIYKYLKIDKKTLRENQSSGALLRFVMRELPQRIVREMERAAVIGDGRSGGREITSFTSIKSDVIANNEFASSYTATGTETLAESVARAKDKILADGSIYLIAKKGFSTEALFEKNTQGDLIFPIGTSAANIFQVAGVIEPSWFNDLTDTTNDAYLVVPSAYKTVGDNSISAFTNFLLSTNTTEYLQEIYKGGALSELKSAVGIATGYSS